MRMKLFTFLLLYLNLFSPLIYPQWIRQTNGLPANWSNISAIDACNNYTAVIGAYNPYILKTEDSGSNWVSTTYPAFVTLYGNVSIYEAIVDITMIDKLHFWICTDAGRILATSDGGTTWSIQFYDTTKTQFMNYIKMFDLNNGIAMGDAFNTSNPALFLKTTDGGTNWISVNDSAFIGAGSGATWMRLDFVNINTGYFRETGITPQKLFKTTNGGKNWLSTNFPYEGGELVKFYDENLGLVVNMDYQNPNISWQMCRTTDGGNTWDTFNMGSKDWPNDIEFIPGNPSKVWYVDLGSLYYSQDTGRTWTEQKIYNGKLWGRDLVFTDSTHGWLLCDSGRVFYTNNNGGNITGIKRNPVTIHAEFMLVQNYPNPFNPTTNIQYAIGSSQFVTLKIFDLLGREIATLVNEEQSEGKHEVEFNADKYRLTSGVYFYTLTANNFSGTKKMFLIK
ncbi:MAG: YCF48-related protein [Ignavibacteriaceae bacterium]